MEKPCLEAVYSFALSVPAVWKLQKILRAYALSTDIEQAHSIGRSTGVLLFYSRICRNNRNKISGPGAESLERMFH